jgi:hypothetical protein
MDAPEKQMSLPARQQVVLDQIERVLQAADPRLKSMFAAFARLASPEAMPATEAISGRPSRRWVVIVSIMVISVLGLVVVLLVTSNKACPSLSSDQVVASATVRFAACSKETEVWSKGGR